MNVSIATGGLLGYGLVTGGIVQSSSVAVFTPIQLNPYATIASTATGKPTLNPYATVASSAPGKPALNPYRTVTTTPL